MYIIYQVKSKERERGNERTKENQTNDRANKRANAQQASTSNINATKINLHHIHL